MGCWNGPFSSRIRETFLVHLLSSTLGWNDLELETKNWLNENTNNLSSEGDERLYELIIINIYKHLEVDFTNPILYTPNYLRKTLQLFCLSLINKNKIISHKEFSDLTFIASLLENKLLDYKKTKGWAYIEFIVCLIILKLYLKQDTEKLILGLLELKDQGNNWYQNVSTTAFALIAIKLSDFDYDFSPFKNFFYIKQKVDKGFSYCDLPFWDTGLSLYTLYLARNFEFWDYKNECDKAVNYLAKNQNLDGGWGFDEGLESEADTSAIILNSLAKYNSEESNKISWNATKYFESLQFKDGKFKELWPVWRKSEDPSMEVVAHIVSALESAQSKLPLKSAKAWILSQINKKDLKADWGKSLTYSISAVTSAVCNNLNQDQRNYLTDLLSGSQNDDGGWGFAKKDLSNVSSTANALLSMYNLGYKSLDLGPINKGVRYLVRNQIPTGTWPIVKEVIGPRPFSYADDSSTNNFILQSLLLFLKE